MAQSSTNEIFAIPRQMCHADKFVLIILLASAYIPAQYSTNCLFFIPQTFHLKKRLQNTSNQNAHKAYCYLVSSSYQRPPFAPQLFQFTNYSQIKRLAHSFAWHLYSHFSSLSIVSDLAKFRLIG